MPRRAARWDGQKEEDARSEARSRMPAPRRGGEGGSGWAPRAKTHALSPRRISPHEESPDRIRRRPALSCARAPSGSPPALRSAQIFEYFCGLIVPLNIII
eukprot:scaffold34_cov271-Prasinococcus_capsulatus_cf.AAC.7